MTMTVAKNKITLHSKGVRGDRVIPFTTLRFNDGTYQVRIPSIGREELTPVFKISCFVNTLDDLIIAGMLTDIIKRSTRLDRAWVELELTSPAYTRYDRVMHEDRSDALGLLVFANMVKATGVDDVLLNDPHSEVTERVLKALGLCVDVKHQKECLLEVLYPNEYDRKSKTMADVKEEYLIFCPDAGAKKKLGDVADFTCFKDRDPKTGKIRGIGIEHYDDLSFLNNSRQSILIIDDLCEKGGTFLGTVKAIRDAGCTLPIGLYVTHGVFPEGTPFEELIKALDAIYVHSMSEDAYYRCSVNILRDGGTFNCENIYKSF